ncbi:hypothetical protein ONS95_006671 [Cadophora gregata]|uniref:uncharacterized protein n=1 Tax=Cadophora gregata TaxID=51156 RepID=UPI0026DDA12A|nr:uncharacterized protein ONS95_006671 [Cadophora gregata]KAK0101503.1 hypothetical protein ONS95_006671 [Cadophora gregata]KAK0106486.1 hypothetical protein ONS96_004112 [Cadophora gregata f. sp. sojae]
MNGYHVSFHSMPLLSTLQRPTSLYSVALSTPVLFLLCSQLNTASLSDHNSLQQQFGEVQSGSKFGITEQSLFLLYLRSELHMETIADLIVGSLAGQQSLDSPLGESIQASTVQCDTPDGSKSARPDTRPAKSRIPEIQDNTASVKPTASTTQVDSWNITVKADPEFTNSNMFARSLRKRKEPPTASADPVGETMQPLTEIERCKWKGWAELESDPALFNYILRKYGVQDVKVQEVFGLDEECMAYVPKPIYGMIFLFKYHEHDAENHEDSQKCPKHVWFANQTTTNACATVALLNIVMNVPGLDFGEDLQTFKEATEKLKPPYRGKRLGENGFIRSIHNSFARKIDILNADLLLKNEYEKWIKGKKGPKKAPANKKSHANKNRKQIYKDEEEGYHFIAYVPIRGEVWRLDGLQREPVKLGKPSST